jgi:phenylalanyl-tRNA synthetase alpha chain
MMCDFSDTQRRRLKELGIDQTLRAQHFNSQTERDRSYQALEDQFIKSERRRLVNFREESRRPKSCRLEQELATKLADEGFVQVSSPVIMSKSSLVKMGISDDHPLFSQVFWLDSKKCLRPMLAPHLYAIARDLLRLWDEPVRLFEIGPCFRKESRGTQHSNEFTMLNLVEFGLQESRRQERIEELTALIMNCAGVRDYAFETEDSEVYGVTVDIVSKPGRMELGSSAMGPHPLDSNWCISSAWVGIGFGLERLIMACNQDSHMGKFARSLTYLDGIRLNI